MLKTSFFSIIARVFSNKPKSEMKPSKIIVGLGNPGAKYRGTRHNIGYAVLEELTKRYATSKARSQFHADAWDAQIGTENVLLLCPTTFMNLSGTSVSEALRFYKLNPKTDLLIVCDDLDLPVAKLRIRESAGTGGQKGLKDVVAKIGSQDFARIRVGIGRPASTDQVVDFVLTNFRKDERDEIDVAIQNAADAARLWAERGCAEAMNRYNVNEKKSPKKNKNGDSNNGAKDVKATTNDN